VDGDLTHTGLAALAPTQRDSILGVILGTAQRREILAPLLLLEGLPAREHWAKVLGSEQDGADWRPLMQAVVTTLDHQSKSATDCRWLRVMGVAMAGKLVLPAFGFGPDLARQLCEYPNAEDGQATIRSLENLCTAFEQAPRAWPTTFWHECMVKTPCWSLGALAHEPRVAAGTTSTRVKEVRDRLTAHAHATRTTTAVDAKHDKVLGVGLYCLDLLRELLGIHSSQSIMARAALRTILECYITLAYLVKKDDPGLWKSYRVFGAGQAKLTFLKIDQAAQKPSYVDLVTLKLLANEDIWQEFLTIDLGHWDNANLRQLSQLADVKGDYDLFYSWTSAFVHGHWGAIRDSVFDSCGNPLHRLHRIPRPEARTLPDVIPDACGLIDKILALIGRCYPDFEDRISV